MDMTTYADAIHDVATYLLGEYDEPWEIDEGAIADQMNDDDRFADLGEYQFLEVRDAIETLIQTPAVAAESPEGQ